jgi:hypothetical protein
MKSNIKITFLICFYTLITSRDIHVEFEHKTYNIDEQTIIKLNYNKDTNSIEIIRQNNDEDESIANILISDLSDCFNNVIFTYHKIEGKVVRRSHINDLDFFKDVVQVMNEINAADAAAEGYEEGETQTFNNNLNVPETKKNSVIIKESTEITPENGVIIREHALNEPDDLRDIQIQREHALNESGDFRNIQIQREHALNESGGVEEESLQIQRKHSLAESSEVQRELALKQSMEIQTQMRHALNESGDIQIQRENALKHEADESEMNEGFQLKRTLDISELNAKAHLLKDKQADSKKVSDVNVNFGPGNTIIKRVFGYFFDLAYGSQPCNKNYKVLNNYEIIFDNGKSVQLCCKQFRKMRFKTDNTEIAEKLKKTYGN